MVILSLLAHPDDAEFLCAGTLIRFARELNWEVHIASMTPGDCGSFEHSREEISAIRRAEGAAAAALIGAPFHCLEENDLRIFYNETTLRKATRLLRQVRPDIVLTHSPADYLLDHEMTSVVARAACFAAAVPNFECDQVERLEAIPHLYYCDAIEGKDGLGRPIESALYIDISEVIEDKAAMLSAHKSQRDWLARQHGMDQYVESMRSWAARCGQRIEAAFAEGFRQHLGHSYPQDDVMADLMGAWPV